MEDDAAGPVDPADEAEAEAEAEAEEAEGTNRGGSSMRTTTSAMPWSEDSAAPPIHAALVQQTNTPRDSPTEGKDCAWALLRRDCAAATRRRSSDRWRGTASPLSNR
jgi:hypothetical protein